MQNAYDISDVRSVERVDNVLAVLPTTAANGDPELVEHLGVLDSEMVSRFRHPSQSMSFGFSAFEQAGWVFVKPTEEVARAFENHQEVAGTAAIGHVYRQSDGRLLVGAATFSGGSFKRGEN